MLYYCTVNIFFYFLIADKNKNKLGCLYCNFIKMALINNSAELALECSVDKLWIDYEWYYEWKCFFLHRKWSDKYTCIHVKYSRLHDMKSDTFSHKIFNKIKNTQFDDEKLYCFFSTHESAPDIVRFSLIFTWKEVKELLSKTVKKDWTKSDYLNILINRKPYRSLCGCKDCLDVTGYLCVKRLERLKSNYLD